MDAISHIEGASPTAWWTNVDRDVLRLDIMSIRWSGYVRIWVQLEPDTYPGSADCYRRSYDAWDYDDAPRTAIPN